MSKNDWLLHCDLCYNDKNDTGIILSQKYFLIGYLLHCYTHSNPACARFHHKAVLLHSHFKCRSSDLHSTK